MQHCCLTYMNGWMTCRFEQDEQDPTENFHCCFLLLGSLLLLTLGCFTHKDKSFTHKDKSEFLDRLHSSRLTIFTLGGIQTLQQQQQQQHQHRQKQHKFNGSSSSNNTSVATKQVQQQQQQQQQHVRSNTRKVS